MPFSNLEKRDMLGIYFACGKNASLANIRYQEAYPERNVPGRKFFKRLYDNLGACGSFMKSRQRRNNVVTEEFEIDVLAYVEANPQTSTRTVASLLNVSHSSIDKVLKKHKYYPFKYRQVQSLYPGDEDRRLTFCAWLLENAVGNRHFLKSIIWTDESNFSNRGMSNRRNTHFWATSNPLLVREGNDQIRFSINCWCAVLNNRVLAVHFYEGNLTGAGYREMLENVLLDSIEDLPLNVRRSLMYQQDGAPAHNSGVVVEFLNNHFPDKWLGTNGPIAWPARSPDLTPLDFFVWGYVKDVLYKERYATVATMTVKVEEILLSIHPNTLKKAVESCLVRGHACLFNNGGHFEHLL